MNPTSSKYGQVNERNLGNEGQKYLEQVTISRVFDVEGLWEVLSEVTQESQLKLPHGDGKMVGADLVEKSNIAFPNTLRGNKVPLIVKEVIDSEDENLTPDEDYGIAAEQPAGQGDEGIQILIVDNMTDIISELFARKEKTEGTFLSSKGKHSSIDT